MSEAAPKQWHFGQWHPLAWVETVIKGIAIVIGIIALLGALGSGSLAVPGDLRLVQWLSLALLSLLYLLAIPNRYSERDILAMVFVVFNAFAHWGIVLALMQPIARPENLVLLFCIFMIAGDAVKLRWLAVTGFTSKGYSLRVMYALVGIYIAGYTLVLLLELLT